jgi:hypothetical protein
MMTSEALTCTEMLAWSELSGIDLEPAEVDLLKALDSVRLRVMHE